MRTISLIVMALALMLASDAAASMRLAQLPSLDPFGADGQPAAYVSYRSNDPVLAARPYSARVVRFRDAREGSLSALGNSSLPFQISPDLRSGVRKRVAYSQCGAAPGSQAVTCAILAQDLAVPVGGTPHTAVVSDPAAGSLDRLPSIYAGAVAFARSSPGARAHELRYTPAGSSTSQRLHGGPLGSGRARVTGLALRGTTIAYVWKRNVASSRVRYTLFTERTGERRHVVVSLDADRGRIIGPVWRGGRVAFAVRRAGSSRLYDYAPGSGTFRSAPGPSMLATFSIGGASLFWQTASSRELSTDTCGPSGCYLYRGGIPAYTRSQAPR